ncbi:MAG TPA: hypothetical protein DD490_16455, partial [Acidobacteria bacterium]|nr:hypothetical protein [Acidobacteriota bacterium]
MCAVMGTKWAQFAPEDAAVAGPTGKVVPFDAAGFGRKEHVVTFTADKVTKAASVVNMSASG